MSYRWNRLVVTLFAAACVLACVSVAFAQTGSAFQPSKDNASEQRYNFRYRDVPITTAIEDLFRQTGYSYSIDQNLRGNITVTLIDLPFSDALTAILRAGNATVRKVGGVYVVGPQKELAAMVPPPTTIPMEIPLQREKIIEKILVVHEDVSKILGLLGASGGTGGLGTGIGGGLGTGIGGGLGTGIGTGVGGGLGTSGSALSGMGRPTRD